jgi:hypothetical protein
MTANHELTSPVSVAHAPAILASRRIILPREMPPSNAVIAIGSSGSHYLAADDPDFADPVAGNSRRGRIEPGQGGPHGPDDAPVRGKSDPDPRRGPARLLDLAALAVIATSGACLLTFGHLSAPDLAAYGAVVTTMYAAWRHHGT